ncbi:DUF2796 domain-containing protein [Marinobacter sp. chi1]|uniref:DUF2796 domain-containing protein n=1 Tax=Marinobacter suaedae TaxID=3057675 RepID=A0ABT8VYC0_9GAMM|nr:DUF2796 domain-containing protein [Marinobacter sp. chi1]MDO3720991.1 DUF2796 domain-containing protein [Marinobacter sp. chi1]
MKRPAPSRFLATFCVTTILGSGTAMAASEAPHVHGHGTLQFVIENSQVDIVFSSPAGNLLGFEHTAHTEEEKTVVRVVTEWLSATPLLNTPSGTCTLKASEPDVDSYAGHQYHDGEHSDIQVSQTLDCPGTGNAPELTTPLLKQYPGLEELDVMWVTPTGQGGTVLTDPQQSIRLN